jgi:hypothetical protein
VKKFFIAYLIFAASTGVSAQTYTSVPLDSHIYNILEQAEMRGLCRPLSGTSPYTRFFVLSAINDIL